MWNMCCNSRNFPILYKFVSFTLAGEGSPYSQFLCVVNAHSLTALSELSHFGGDVKHCCNAAPILHWRAGESFLPGWCSLSCLTPHSTLILGTLARGWWHLSHSISSDPVQTVQKPPEMFRQWFTILRASSAWNSTFIIAPEGFGITKPQLCFISQKLFYLLKADVERGWPARGQGLNPLLPYICVYRFHNAGFGSESLTLCVQALNPHLWSLHVLAQHM